MIFLLLLAAGAHAGAIGGWEVDGEAHHVIVWELDAAGARTGEMAYVWAGAPREMYPPGGAFVGAGWEAEVHRGANTTVRAVPVTTWKWEVRIVATAVRAGVVAPGGAVTTPAAAAARVVAVRMHSHHAARQVLRVGGRVAADSARHAVGAWVPASGTGALSATCWYSRRSGVGVTACFGCAREMCDAYALVRRAK